MEIWFLYNLLFDSYCVIVPSVTNSLTILFNKWYLPNNRGCRSPCFSALCVYLQLRSVLCKAW